MSKMLEEIGVKITLIKYGEHKVDANPYEPLSESAEAELQAGVDFYGQLFDKAVAKGRDKTTDVIRSTFGQGRMFHRYLKVNDACPQCGGELHHHRADDACARPRIDV